MLANFLSCSRRNVWTPVLQKTQLNTHIKPEINPSHPNAGRKEKINLNFYFHTFVVPLVVPEN